MIYIKINDMIYPATVSGKVTDRAWNNRESKSIKLEMDINEIIALFKDGIKWSIVETGLKSVPSVDENGEVIYIEEEFSNEYNNDEFNVLGDIIIHADGSCTVTMGKETTEEKLITMIYGGVE